MRYLNHIDLLEKFIIYFKEKAAHLINTAEQSPIIIMDKLVKDIPPAPLNKIQLDRDRFMQQVISADLIQFSAREYDCIKWFKQGYSLKMIANELNISPRTVETHFEHIKQKAQCHTRSELVKYLARVG
ncbi:MAG TPA: helix-turn-helix transcriptional regulator [Gammaproteobacteria bacterium]|nr:helix-turn-helix transcriptional regulator [Gammaproteobacteria bacterium]